MVAAGRICHAVLSDEFKHCRLRLKAERRCHKDTKRWHGENARLLWSLAWQEAWKAAWQVAWWQQYHAMEAESRSTSIPSFLCPIGYELMRDPVLLTDGHSYEKEHIESWLFRNSTSPMTGSSLPPTYTRNHALRNAIHEFLEREAKGRDGQWAAAELETRRELEAAGNSTSHEDEPPFPEEAAAAMREAAVAMREAAAAMRAHFPWTEIIWRAICATFLFAYLFIAGMLLSAGTTVAGGAMASSSPDCTFPSSDWCRNAIGSGARCGPAVLLPIHYYAVRLQIKALRREGRVLPGVVGWFAGCAFSFGLVVLGNAGNYFGLSRLMFLALSI